MSAPQLARLDPMPSPTEEVRLIERLLAACQQRGFTLQAHLSYGDNTLYRVYVPHTFGPILRFAGYSRTLPQLITRVEAFRI